MELDPIPAKTMSYETLQRVETRSYNGTAVLLKCYLGVFNKCLLAVNLCFINS